MSFQVGDLIIHTGLLEAPDVFVVTGFVNGYVEFKSNNKGYPPPLEFWAFYDFAKNLRLATPEEIEAGHRIDTPQLEVLEMIDVSPNCEVSEL